MHWPHCLGRLVLKAVRCPKSVGFHRRPSSRKIGVQLPLPLKELKTNFDCTPQLQPALKVLEKIKKKPELY
jgi:hypothetical protein